MTRGNICFASLTASVLAVCAACGSSDADDMASAAAAGASPTGGRSSAAAGMRNDLPGMSNGAAGTGSGVAGASGVAGMGGGAAASNGSGGDMTGSATAGNANAGAPSSGAAGAAGAAGASGAAAGGSSNTGSLSFEFARVTVTGVRGTTSPRASAGIKLHNGGATPLQVDALRLSGANASLFEIASPVTLPTSIAAGADLPVTLQMTTAGAGLPPDLMPKDLGAVLLNGTLIASSGASTSTVNVYGLVLARVNYEATLGQILTTLGYALNVGKAQNNWNPNTSMDANTLPKVETGTDEVAAPRFVKAGTGKVGMTLAARFSPKGPLPYGYYTTTTGCPAGCTQVGVMANEPDPQTSDKARMVKPPIGAGSMESFDPGTTPFGIWVYTDQKTQKYDSGNAVNGDYNYSQDVLNLPTNTHRFKSYPLKDAAGVRVPHSYLLAIEEAGNGDYQDYVFVLTNVEAAP